MIRTLAIAAIGIVTSTASAELIVTVNGQGGLVTWDTNTLTAVSGALLLGPGGIQDRYIPADIDFRPDTGELFGIDGTGIRTINRTTGLCLQVGNFAPTIPNDIAIDFNPTVDRMRVVGTNASNRRVDPNTGLVISNDTGLTYANVPGVTPTIGDTAYSNSVPGAPLGSTRQFVIDIARLTLGEVGSQAGGNPSFNAGVITEIGNTGLGSQGLVSIGGFDISPNTGIAYLTYSVGVGGGRTTWLSTVDLSTGQATILGQLGAPSFAGVLGMAVVPVPAPGAVALFGPAALALTRRRR